VAHQLLSRGIRAVALEGGFNAWQAAHPVEPVSAAA
jgi:hypothetical protein